MSIAISESTAAATGGLPLVLQMRPVVDLSDERLFDYCQLNRDLRIERTAQGELLVMAPAGDESSIRNLEISRQHPRLVAHGMLPRDAARCETAAGP